MINDGRCFNVCDVTFQLCSQVELFIEMHGMWYTEFNEYILKKQLLIKCSLYTSSIGGRFTVLSGTKKF